MNEYEPEVPWYAPWLDEYEWLQSYEAQKLQRAHELLVQLGFVSDCWNETRTDWRLKLRDALRKSGL